MSRTSRRAFAKTLTVASVGLPLLAQTPAAPKVEKPPSELAKALTELVRAESGKYLDHGELAKMEKDFEDAIPFIQRLREFKLVNSDEPDFTFAALTKR